MGSIDPREVVGLVPAAGRATRLALVDHSKEMLAVPDRAGTPGATVPVCHYLFRQYARAGLVDVRMLRRTEKHDIGAHLARGPHEGLSVRDVVIEPTDGSVHTFARGIEAARDAAIAVGFPDIVIEPETLCREALAGLLPGVDACIGAVPVAEADRPAWDMLDMDGARVARYELKPPASACTHGTALAVWRPSFSEFLLDWLDDPRGAGQLEREVSLGDAFQAALANGLIVHAHRAPAGFALDIGEPERLERAAGLGQRAE